MYKDYFSIKNTSYNIYRPEYPEQLFNFISNQCEETEFAWDCATGSGQAARGLSNYFNRILATDISEAQLLQASAPKNVLFKIADAYNSGLMDSSVDLITVAQALHWFNFEKFYIEVKRILKPNGLIAVWSYGLLNVDPQINSILYNYHDNIIGKFWPKERKHVVNGYKTLPFPFKMVDVPNFSIELDWTLEQFLGYLRTWSGTKRYCDELKKDPIF